MVLPIESSEKSGGEMANGSSLELYENHNLEPEREKEKSTYKIRMEVAAFLFFFGVNLAYAAFQDEVMYLSCTVVYGYNGTICDAVRLGKGKTDPQIQSIENIVQPLTANIYMAEALVKAIVPAILALFIGSWTDKFGRKPVILITTAGYLCYSSIKAIIAGVSLVLPINPWLYVIASIPLSLCGGDVTLRTAILCYVADLTTVRERPFRLCIITGTMEFSGIIGQMASGYMYAATNACAVFAVSAATKLMGIIFVVFAIEESVKKDQISSDSKFEGFYNGQLLKDMFKALLKKREHYETPVIWCTIVLIVSIAFDTAGIGDIYYLFLRKIFGWNIEQATVFNAGALVITYVCATCGTYLLQYKLRIRLTIMASITYVSCLGLAIFFCTAFAFSAWYLYVVVIITCFNGVAIPLAQAMLSNIVSPCDIGKILTFVAALQAIVPLIAAPMYTFVYNATIATFPSAFNLISVGLYVVCLVLILFIHAIEKRFPKINIDKAK